MTLQAGDELPNGKCTIVKELGKGRFGVTYLAKDSHDNNLVIKTLKDNMYDELSPDEINKFQNKLLAEAAKLAECQNAHIVKFKGSFLELPRVYLAMEHIAGDDLASLPDKTLPETDALNYIQQIGEALTVVHQKGLLHLDVKPDNIILRAGKPEVVLIDFGLARGLDDGLSTRNTSTADGFAALELYDPTAPRGPYTDVYGLAATLYVLLTGKIPPSAMKISLKQEQLIAPKKVNPNIKISDAVNKAIMLGMKLDAEDRPQTIKEWLELLPLPGEEKPPETPNSEEEALKLSKQQTFLAIVAIVVTALIGLLTILITLFPQETRQMIENFFPSPSSSPTPQSTNRQN